MLTKLLPPEKYTLYGILGVNFVPKVIHKPAGPDGLKLPRALWAKLLSADAAEAVLYQYIWH